MLTVAIVYHSGFGHTDILARAVAQGVGEAGAIASTPAIINGIVDALRPLGVNDVLMPASPQNVWRAIQAAKGASR